MNCSIGIKFIILAFVLLVSIFLPAKNVLAQDCQNWATVANIGGVIKYDPAVMAAGDRLIIVAAGSDNALWENEFIPATGQNEWFGLDGSIISGPSLAQDSDGKITASAMGSDNIVWNRTYQSSKNWTEWLKTNSSQLGALGPSQATFSGLSYRVIKGSNNTVEVDKCADVPICRPGAVSGCQVCKADGSGWVDDNLKCAKGQYCSEGQCKTSTLIQKMKTKGCLMDNVLGGVEDFDNYASLLKRSSCGYVQRAVNMWNNPPNFDLIKTNLNKIGRPDLIYGVNIPEEVTYLTPSGAPYVYYYPDESRNFDFEQMCYPGTKGKWNPGTCIPYLKSLEYRKYLRYVTRKFVDLGFQDFHFGNVFFTEDMSDPQIKDVISEMRSYATSKSKEIVVGAQTNDVSDESYLRNFDYISAIMAMDENGNIESGPCSSRETSFCAALLWNDKYALKANNVIVTLDYAVKCTDDMNVFSQMSSVLRAKVLREKYDFFTSKGMGFLMPFRTTLCGNGAGCYGVNPWVYSPDSHAFWPVSSDNHHPFSCDDEDAINSILNGTNTCGSGVISGCKVCKADGSGWVDDNSRCASGQVCSSGVCVSACVAKTCSSLNYSCGFASDGCGYNTLNCGICEPGQICNGGICKSNGGGGGGNPNPPVQPVVTKSITKMTRAEILAAIAQIQALIADLKKQLAALGGPMATFSCTQITKNLFYGTKNDPQVKCLQEVLKSRGYVVAVSGNYDAATRTAVAQFQQKYASEILALYHLTRGSGNVGNATREKINLFINKK